MGTPKHLLSLFLLCILSATLFAQQANMHYTISMEPETHFLDVTLTYELHSEKDVRLQTSAWAPGDYRIHNYQADITNFKAAGPDGKPIQWEKPSNNSWLLHTGDVSLINITYRVKADTPTIDYSFVDTGRALITPVTVFMYADEELHNPVTVQIKPYEKWNGIIATGLDSLAGKKNTFLADNFDILFDSPFLMGNIELLPSFRIRNVPHYFAAYGLGAFDRNAFIADLHRIVEQGIDIIGDIPYSHYTFLDIGRGGGGIEHLNSTAIGFRTPNLVSDPNTKRRNYTLLAHEYFHAYNVKRIRPIALGPFDYTKENYTNMLWVSEGISDYYAYLMVHRAGLMTDEELFNEFRVTIGDYENKPGHLVQSATQASHDSWNESPFGKTEAQESTSISYYDKGCALGLLLDFKIRHVTRNKHTLDDVMRTLYTKYYQTLKRGFTDEEFQGECEKIAGVPLTECFEYASTVKPVDYSTYFSYAGLSIDTITREKAYLGISMGIQHDATLPIADVSQRSPAWNAGLRSNDRILAIDGKAASRELYTTMLQSRSSGDNIRMKVIMSGQTRDIVIKLAGKSEKSFTITKLPNPDSLQQEILKSWLSVTGRPHPYPHS